MNRLAGGSPASVRELNPLELAYIFANVDAITKL